MNKRYIDFVPVRPTAVRPRTIVSSPKLAKAPKSTQTPKSTTPVKKSRVISKKTEIELIKAQKISARPMAVITKTATPSKSKTQSKAQADPHKIKFSAPVQPHFINTKAVAKRPLSKNVYEKPAPVPTEEPTEPVTIIAKTEKDSHSTLIITIIITIILGAAVGTIAFLLLPR